jgi:acetyl esterase/lipase
MFPLSVLAQMVMSIYDGPVPGSKKSDTKEVLVNENNGVRISKVVTPSITAFLPTNLDTATPAVIICPGGGYGRLAMTHEGYDVANRFKEAGIAAFVLKYRLPSDSIMVDKTTGPLQDAQQAIYLVKKNASAWNIDPTKVGMMGFSAGGHLASTAGTHFTKAVYPNKENISVRPDFMMLIYPVISFSDSLAHMGSRTNLVGNDAGPDLIKLYSNEMQVTAQTPPTFLVHAADDKTVKANNSLVFAQALMKYNIPVEVHIYPKGGHGFGMINKTTKADWFLSALDWMRAGGWLR